MRQHNLRQTHCMAEETANLQNIKTMLKDERGHYDDGYPLRWKPEDYGSMDVIRKRDEHIYPYELYSFNEVAVLFLAPRVREIVAGLKGVYGYDQKMRRVQYAFDTLEKLILEHPDDSLGSIFENRLSQEEKKKVQSGLNSFARNLIDMEY